MEIQGKLHEKFEEVQITDSFKKREFVLIKEENVNGKIYTDYIKFQLTQDRCGLIDSVNIGDEVDVKFNLKGRKYEKDGNTMYFNSEDAWKIEKVSRQNENQNNESSDDLPF